MDNQSPELFGPTPSQTVGPFFHYALPWHGCADLLAASGLGARPDLFPPEHDVLHRTTARDEARGEPIEIAGTVRDGEGAPVPDALIETWQADADGRYAAGFAGLARAATERDGTYLIRTVRPGRVGAQAPHVAVGVLGRGLLKRLVTRVYFGDDTDAVLASVPAARRHTLIARLESPGRFRFDIVLQGADETVFFAL